MGEMWGNASIRLKSDMFWRVLCGKHYTPGISETHTDASPELLWGQPLAYLARLTLPGQLVHETMYVCTCVQTELLIAIDRQVHVGKNLPPILRARDPFNERIRVLCLSYTHITLCQP